jgi:hypothetical protein
MPGHGTNPVIQIVGDDDQNVGFGFGRVLRQRVRRQKRKPEGDEEQTGPLRVRQGGLEQMFHGHNIQL